MTIRNVEEMVHAYQTSAALRGRITDIMFNESELIELETDMSVTICTILTATPFIVEVYKGFQGAKLGKRV